MSRFILSIFLVAFVTVCGATNSCRQKQNGQYCGTNNDVFVCKNQVLQSDTVCSPLTCVTTGSTTAQCQDTYCATNQKTSGTYCDPIFPNSLTSCSGTTTTLSSCPSGETCVVTGSGTAACQTTFCKNLANGNYCSSSGLVYQCSGGTLASSTTCTSGSFCYDSNAVDVNQDGVLGSGGNARCTSNNYNSSITSCQILPGYTTGAYCNNSLVYECFEAVSFYSEVNPCPYGQVCWAPNNLNVFGNGYLCGNKVCTGKTLAGYYCGDSTYKYFPYCPGSSNIPEENVPVNLNGAFGTNFYTGCVDGTTNVGGVTYAYPTLV